MTNVISIKDKYNIQLKQIQIQLRQIQYPFKKNAIFSLYKCNTEIFPDLTCAVHLDTSRQFVASVFWEATELVVRIHVNFYQQKIEGIFLGPICAVHLVMSLQFVASSFGIPFGVGINGNIYSSSP